MAKLKKSQLEPINSPMEKRDILTEMFEHFGIKVVDAGSQIPKAKKKKRG